jgi:pimeloyl-ACP methyl ester carboxylesterase
VVAALAEQLGGGVDHPGAGVGASGHGPDQLGTGKSAIYVTDFGAAAGSRLALRHPGRLSAIIVQTAPLHPREPRGWWATLGQYRADGSAGHRHAARSYLDRDGLRGQYLPGVQDPSRIDPDNWVIDKALIDRPGVDEIMLDPLYDIPSNVPAFKAMQEFLRERRPPTLVATGATEIAALMRDFLARTVPRA